MSKHRRTCSSCSYSKSKIYFSPSIWAKPLTHSVECIECVDAKKRSHPTYKPKPGFIYVISNKVWPGWYKVGLTTTSVEDRLQSYNIGSPHRDYVTSFAIAVPDVRYFEKKVHKALRATGSYYNNEWFEINLYAIISIIKELDIHPDI